MDASSNPHVIELLRQGGDSFVTSRAEAVLAWSRKYSLSPYPFASGCCTVEFTSVSGPRYDLDRFGCGLPRFSARQSDLLLVLGTITWRQAPILQRAYARMAEPKWVFAFGGCACTGGPYDNYATVQGVDTLLPVDVYVPGCPPRPEAVIDGLLKLQARIQAERVPETGRQRGFRASLASS